MNMNELSSRVERLERENRWMKRAGLALVGVALAVALIGAATPDVIPEVIDARRFRVIDEKGTTRAWMHADGIAYKDDKGDLRVAMGADGIVYADEKGKLRATMGADGFAYADEKGTVRAQIGVVETVNKDTGKESRYPAGVALFDDDGDVIWMAPE